MKNVFVLGGTGLLGYHTVMELLGRGYEVSTIALPPMPSEDILPAKVNCRLGNINEMSDEEVLKLFEGMDMFVYAAGVDERVVPDAPADAFFYRENVLPTQRIARLARKAGIKRFVIFGSYFAHFAEQWTDLPLMEQAYPRTRILQEEVAIMEGSGVMDVMILRLPYIFGTMPGRKPLWEMFLPQIQGNEFVPVLGGGSAMITVKQVAEAAIGALEHGEHGGTYAISGTNMKHKAFFEIIAEVLGQKNTVVQVVDLEQMKPGYIQGDEQAAKEGKEHGIHLALTAEIQNRDAYLDPADTMPILQYNEDDIHAAIVESIKACLKL